MANIVQYIIVNKDIITKLGWPLGAIIAQCCHATTAVGHLFKDDAEVKTYFDDIDNMHKVVLEVRPTCNNSSTINIKFSDSIARCPCIFCIVFVKFQHFQIGSEDELRKLSADLTTNEIKHKLWIEQPENIATCIAFKPYEKDAVKKFTKKYKMLK